MLSPRPANSTALDFTALECRIQSLVDVEHLTALERECLWRNALETFNAGLAAGTPEKVAKEEIARWLFSRNVALSESEPALIRNLERKYVKWMRAGQVLDGRREANKAKRAPLLAKADRDELAQCAVFKHGGDVDPAWAECLAEKRLSREILDRYPLPRGRRPSCPRAVRRQVQAEIRAVMPWHRGPRQARLNGAYIQRDWSGVSAGDWYSSDDITLPVYYYIDDGKGWYQLTRGQFLPMIDVKSKRILDFVLIDGKSYNAFAIRSLTTLVCERVGLPRRGYHWECGIWKAKILGGTSNALSDLEVEENFAQRCGIRVSHAQPGNARSKVVENVAGLFQNLLEGEAGYVGRDEIHEKFERVQAAKRDVESRRKAPWEAGFLSAEAWIARLHEICAQYNAKPQESDIMGRYESPDEAWERCQPRNEAGQVVGLVKLPAQLRYLLAAHREIRTVGRNGVSFVFGKERFVYKNEDTGRLQGQSVITWFDPGNPGVLCITDMKQENPCVVPRISAIPAFDATREQMDGAAGANAAHTSYPRARYSELRCQYKPPVRTNLVAPETLETARQMEERKAKISTANARKEPRRQEADQRWARSSLQEFLT